MVVPTLTAEQFQYTDAGVLINGDVAVPFIDLEKIAGLDSAEIRASTHEREGLDGGYIDAFYEQMRTVILDGVIYADTLHMETYLDQCKANFAPSLLPQPFYFGTDAGVRVVYGKSLGFKYDKDTIRRLGMGNCQVQVVCEDPRIYDPSIVTASVFPSAVALTGRGYNKSYPYGYGGSSGASNQLTLTLGGNRDQPGIIRIYGPIINPQVINDDNSVIMDFAITIANGDYLEINLNNRTVKLNGTAGRRNTLSMTGRWYLFQAGANHLRLNGTGITGGVTQLYASANAAAWR